MSIRITVEITGKKCFYLKDYPPRGSNSKYITRIEKLIFGSKEYVYTLKKTVELQFQDPNINFGHIEREIKEELKSTQFLETDDSLCLDEWPILNATIKEITFDINKEV